MSNDFASLQSGYIADFNRMQIVPGRAQAIEAAARKIIANEARYTIVEKATTALWFVVGLLHMRESDFDFSTHLYNGDSLKHRTVDEPKGLPLTPEPPYAWEASAIGAIRYDGLDKIAAWSVVLVAYAAEKFNGFGPRNHGRKSGYLWAGTTVYDGGKYVADDKWDPDAQDSQLGVMAVLDELISLRPDIAADLNRSAQVLKEQPPITIADAKASHPQAAIKAGAGYGIFAIGVAAWGHFGLHLMLVLAALIFGGLAALLWHFIAIQGRLDHLQTAADAPAVTRPEPAADPAPALVTATTST